MALRLAWNASTDRLYISCPLEYPCIKKNLLINLISQKQPPLWITKHYHSQTRRLLSSLVVTNLLFSSTNVIVFTAPKCRSYSWVISPERISHYTKIHLLIIQFQIYYFQIISHANCTFIVKNKHCHIYVISISY